MELSTFVRKKPYKCPVCNGRGVVPAAYYRTGGYLTYYLSSMVTCRTCNGKGIVWAPMSEKEEPDGAALHQVWD